MLQIGLQLALLVPKDLSVEGLAQFHGLLCTSQPGEAPCLASL